MSFTAWTIVLFSVVAGVAAYIDIVLQLEKMFNFADDLYRDISEVYREIDELERKYREMYHENDDAK